MAVKQVFAGIAVGDRDKAAEWYGRLFGRPADNLPNDYEAVWQMVDSALVYLVAEEGRAGHSSLALVVDDLDIRMAGIRERGIETGSIVEGPYRMTIVVDPEGNKVTFVELRPMSGGSSN